MEEEKQNKNKKVPRFSAHSLCELLQEPNKALMGRILAYIGPEIIHQVIGAVDDDL